MRNYYEILDISVNASKAQIKQAYLLKCKAYHPDLHDGAAWAEAHLKLVNEAYQVLYDTFRRQSYDHKLFDLGHKAAIPVATTFPLHPSSSQQLRKKLAWGASLTILLLLLLIIIHLLSSANSEPTTPSATAVHYQTGNKEKNRFLAFCNAYPNLLSQKQFLEVMKSNNLPSGFTYHLRLHVVKRDTAAFYRLIKNVTDK